MATIFKIKELEFVEDVTNIPQFNIHTIVPRLSKIVNTKNLIFDIRSLAPGRFSFPYHFHRSTEELIFIISGSLTMRSPQGLQILNQGECVFFETGETGAHQFFNHDKYPCIYLDIKTNIGIDICEYPDSNKICISPNDEVFDKAAQVDYFKGENDIEKVWESLI